MITLDTIDPALYPWQSAHQAELEAFFGDRLLRPLDDEEKEQLARLQVFLVTFTNRCGSNLLCNLLNRAGAGIPEASEPLNRTTALPLAREHGISTFTDYLLGYLTGWQREGSVGIKIGPQQLFWLRRTGLLSHSRQVVVVDCRRRDRLNQAISHYLARASGQWHSGMSAAEQDIPYSADEILASLEDIGRGRELIERYLAIHQAACLPVDYEDVLENQEAELARVAAFLGIELDGGVEPGLQKQAGRLNKAFRERFLEDFAGR